MRASYLMSGVATGLRRNASMSVALVLSTAIALMFGVGALLLNKEITKTQDHYKGKLNVSIYLCTKSASEVPGGTCQHALTDSERSALDTKLRSDALVTDVTFVSQDEAVQIAKDRLGASVVAAAGADAIPASFIVKLKDIKADYPAIAKNYSTQPGVEEVQNQDVSLKAMLKLFDTGKYSSYVMALIIGICALIQMANTIQVAAAQRRNETGIMRLVGASRWMTQLPFIIEAVLAAAVGAILATVGAFIARVVFLDGLLGEQVKSNLIQPISTNDILLTGGLGLILGVAIAAATAYGTLRLYVRL